MDIIYKGVDKKEIPLLFEMQSLYSKITRCFFLQIDVPRMGYELPKDTDTDKITSVANSLYNIILDVLYKGNDNISSKTIDLLADVKNGRIGLPDLYRPLLS